MTVGAVLFYPGSHSLPGKLCFELVSYRSPSRFCVSLKVILPMFGLGSCLWVACIGIFATWLVILVFFFFLKTSTMLNFFFITLHF
jgi:hypothetical protein